MPNEKSKNSKKKNVVEEMENALDNQMLQFALDMWSDVRRYLKETESIGRKYSREDIRKFLETPNKNSENLIEASLYLLTTSSHYLRLALYLSTMLTLDYIIIPLMHNNKNSISDAGFRNNYIRAVNYMENFNVKHELGKIIFTLVTEDVFYGYERSVGNSFTIQKMPRQYCKITSVEDGVLNYSFNMEYFQGREDLLDNFPEDFRVLYKNYQETGEKWQEVNGDKAVCFKFREDLPFPLPPFTSVFEEILDLEDIKDLMKARNKLENFKLLVQKIPFKKDAKNEKDFLIGLETVKQFHKNIKAVLPEQIGLISTPMELEEYSFEKKRDTILEGLVQTEQNIFNSAGISQGLFNSNSGNAISINRGINVDEAVMFKLLRQFERFFNKRLNKITSNSYMFKVMFPDLTVYNREKMIDTYLKMAQYGYPKLLVGCALGLTPERLMGLTMLENDYLNLLDYMQPLSSSHTQSGKEDEKGRPQKDENDLDNTGVKTREKADNENRE